MVRVSGFGFRVSGFGLRVSGFGCWLSGVGCRVSGFGCRVCGVGCRVSAVGCGEWGVGCWVLGVGCGVLGVRCAMCGVGCWVWEGGACHTDAQTRPPPYFQGPSRKYLHGTIDGSAYHKSVATGQRNTEALLQVNACLGLRWRRPPSPPLLSESDERKETREVDTRLPEKGNSNSHVARPVY